MIHQQYVQYQLTQEAEVINFYKDQRTYPIYHKPYTIEVGGQELKQYIEKKKQIKSIQEAYKEHVWQEQNPELDYESFCQKQAKKQQFRCPQIVKTVGISFLFVMIVFLLMFVFLVDKNPTKTHDRTKHQKRKFQVEDFPAQTNSQPTLL